VKIIPLTRGFVALVDDEDYERVIAAGPWHASSANDGCLYAVHSVVCKSDGTHTTLRMHRFLLGITNPHVQADHINHDGLDNQRHNIRRCLHQQNQANSCKRPETTSRFRGVCWNKCHGKWEAKIKIDGKNIFLGYFADEIAAAHAYDAAARELFGEFANPNFPDGSVNEQERNGY